MGRLENPCDRCDPTLHRNSRQMPLLHHICYLTLVLEEHCMPRKTPGFELFADLYWSDETNYVRNGRDWLAHLERITGGSVAPVSPF